MGSRSVRRWRHFSTTARRWRAGASSMATALPTIRGAWPRLALSGKPCVSRQRLKLVAPMPTSERNEDPGGGRRGIQAAQCAAGYLDDTMGNLAKVKAHGV